MEEPVGLDMVEDVPVVVHAGAVVKTTPAGVVVNESAGTAAPAVMVWLFAVTVAEPGVTVRFPDA